MATKLNDNQEHVGLLETIEGVLHIYKQDGYMHAGYAFNVGVNSIHSIKLDDTFSDDELLQELIEEMEENGLYEEYQEEE